MEEKINAYLTAKPSEGGGGGVQPRSKVLPAAAGKEVKLLRAQIDEAKLTIAKVMEENEKMKVEITEGTTYLPHLIYSMWREADFES